MMRRKIAVALLVLGLLQAVVVGAVLAANEGSGVRLLTAPLREQVPVYIDLNGNGTHEESEFVGTFDVYASTEIAFSWNEVSGAESYQVRLRQWSLPYSGTSGPYTETKLAHHWASNPNGTLFVMGSLGTGEPLCYGCPSVIMVSPETVTKFYDPLTDTYEYAYAPLETALVLPQQSEAFVFEQPPPYMPPPQATPASGGLCSVCGNNVCNIGCGEDDSNDANYCPADCNVLP
jgi:hypothetical protein